jgi:hypothetical protein
MNITALTIQLVSGAIGGNVGGSLIGSLLSESNLGFVGNSIVGVIAGGLGGQFLSNMLTSYGMANGDETSFTLIILSIFGGGIAGIAAVSLAGIVKSKMSRA